MPRGDRGASKELSIVLPPRLSLFGPPRGDAFRVPSALMTLFNIPFLIALFFAGLDVSLRVYSGVGLFGEGAWIWPAGVSAPAVLLDLLYLAGRLEWVDALPDPGQRDVPRPALALLGAADAGGLRPTDTAVRSPRGRRSVDGMLFAGGLSALGTALALMLLQQNTFDSVLGIKLGGIPFRGTYWNRWWFVFYGFLGSGAAMLTAAAALFMRRLNRKDE